MNQHMDAINTLGYCKHPSPLVDGSPDHLYGQQPALDYSSPSSCSTPYPLMYADPTAAATPLTPAVSPSLYDSEHFNRKYSVDVGPFSFASNSSDLQSYLDRQDELFRRSSMCTDMSMNECIPGHNHIGNYASFLASTSEIEDNDNGSKSKATQENARMRVPGDGPAVQHKHVCKYSFCGWSFKRYEHLKRHMLVHTGERPHVCHYPGCGKSFSRSDNFHAHCRTHNKKNGFQGTSGRRTSRTKSTATTASSAISCLPTSTLEEPIGPQADPQQRPMEYSGEPDYLNNVYEQRSAYQLNANAAGFDYMPFGTGPMLNPGSGFLMADGADYVRPFSGDDGMIMNPWPTYVGDGSTAGSVTAEGSPTDAMTGHDSASAATVATAPVQLKSHVCLVPMCQRRFKRLEHLKRHMRIHTLERPFSCTFLNCRKSFSRSDNLSQHMKTHQRHEDRRKRQQQQQQDMTYSLSHDRWC